jgi:hypothetical protein
MGTSKIRPGLWSPIAGFRRFIVHAGVLDDYVQRLENKMLFFPHSDLKPRCAQSLAARMHERFRREREHDQRSNRQRAKGDGNPSRPRARSRFDPRTKRP